MIIDFHAHILPGADHGCSGAGESSRQLELAYRAGIDLVVATPHFYPDRETLGNFLARRAEAEAELRSLAPDRPAVLVGSEATVCKGIDRLEGIEELCVAGTRCIVLEMPFTVWDGEYIETVRAVRDRLGLAPVMAHIDRYPAKEAAKLLEIGVCFQLNAEGVCRFFQRGRLFKLVDQGRVFALGSDMHGTRTGYAEYEKARRLLGRRFDEIMARSAELLAPALASQNST